MRSRAENFLMLPPLASSVPGNTGTPLLSLEITIYGCTAKTI